MAPLQAVSDLYAAQQRRTLTATLATREQWAKAGSPAKFGRVVNSMFALIASAQLGAAREAAQSVPAALEESGYPEAQLARVRPAGMAGWASDGRPLEPLLWLAPDIAAAGGKSLSEQMAAGQAWLDLMVHRQVTDAGRAASSVAITSTARAGYVRFVSPPCCQRCAVLAGKFFRYNTGFDRHLRCDCIHRPTSSREPADGYADMVSTDQITDLTEAQRKAVEDGADLNQVVNAYRGRSAGLDKMMTTAEGTTKRGYASYIQRAVDRARGQSTQYTVSKSSGRRNVTRTKARPTPERIYQIAETREEAVRMLTLHGYVVGDIGKLARSVA